MAPELFAEQGPPSVASDMWALGCMLYELGTGYPPFVADTLDDLIPLVRMTAIQVLCCSVCT